MSVMNEHTNTNEQADIKVTVLEEVTIYEVSDDIVIFL